MKDPEERAGMADPEPGPIYGQVTITWYGPGAWKVEPATGLLNRDVQTMTWTLINASDAAMNFQPKFPVPVGGIVFKRPGAGSGLSQWNPPGTVPTGSETVYSASANDRVPHGSPAKKYEYDVFIDYYDGESNARHDHLSMSAYVRSRQEELRVEEIDPPIENEPQP